MDKQTMFTKSAGQRPTLHRNRRLVVWAFGLFCTHVGATFALKSEMLQNPGPRDRSRGPQVCSLSTASEVDTARGDQRVGFGEASCSSSSSLGKFARPLARSIPPAGSVSSPEFLSIISSHQSPRKDARY